MNLKWPRLVDRPLDGANKYHEIVKSDNFLQIENTSLDFMAQTNSSWDEFRLGIVAFRASFLKERRFVTASFTLLLIPKKVKARTILTPEIDVASHCNNASSAYFFTDRAKNEWMLVVIEKLLASQVALEIFPGLVLQRANGVFKLIVNQFQMEQHGS